MAIRVYLLGYPARSRREAKEYIHSRRITIWLHLLKIWVLGPKTMNYEHWIREIAARANEIAFVKAKGKFDKDLFDTELWGGCNAAPLAIRDTLYTELRREYPNVDDMMDADKLFLYIDMFMRKFCPLLEEHRNNNKVITTSEIKTILRSLPNG